MELKKKHFVYYTIVLLVGVVVLNTQISVGILVGSSMTPLWSEQPTLTVLDTTESVSELEENDIVSYTDQEYDGVTHRIYDISDEQITVNGDTLLSVERTYSIEEFKNRYNGTVIWSYDTGYNQIIEPGTTTASEDQMESYISE